MQIYLITNIINNKQYVGQTVLTLQQRWRNHRNDKNGCVALRNAIKKYGAEHFTLTLLQKCKTIKSLDKAEMAWIKKLNTIRPNGYNIQEGGHTGNRGITFSEATRKKLRRKKTEQEKLKMKEASRRRWDSEAGQVERTKLSNLKKGKPLNRKQTPQELDNLKKGIKFKKGENRGEKNIKCLLKEQDVLKIRELYATGNYSQQEIGKMYGRPQITISCIVTRRTWKHI